MRYLNLKIPVPSLYYNLSNLRSGTLTLESLCIEEGRYCWYVEVSLIALIYDGNMIGASSTAVLAALRDGM